MKKSLLLKPMLLLFALIVGSSSVWADDATINIGINPTGLSTNGQVSYNTTEQEFTIDGVTFKMNNYNPKSGQIRGNQGNNSSVSTSNFYLYNTTAIPGSLKSISITVSSTGTNTINDSYTFLNTGTSLITTATTSGTHPSSASWSNLSGTFFCIGMAKGGTSGTCTISGITITYTPSASGTTAAPTISGEEIFFSEREVSITNASSATGATIYYTTNGDAPTTNSSVYSEPFTISATTTVKAIALKTGDTNASSVVEKTFTKTAYLSTLADLVTQTTAQDYYVDMTGVQVTYRNNSANYMQDANTGCYAYGVGATKNTLYDGICKVNYEVYQGMPEIKSITLIEGESSSSTAENDVPAAAITTSTLTESNFTSYLAKKLELSNLKLTSATQLNNDVAFYTYSGVTLTEGKVYSSIVGYPYNNNGTLQFRVTQATEKTLAENTITVTGNNVEGTEFTIDRENNESTLTLSGSSANNAAVSFAIDTDNTTLAATDYTFENNVLIVTGTTGGYIYIDATAAGDLDYADGSASIKVTVEGQKTDPTIVVNESETVAYGSTFTIDDSMIEGGEITVTSDNTFIATVNGLVITPVAVGTTTIRVNTAADATYRPGNAQFTLTVTAPAGGTTAYVPAETIFEETFDECDGTGGNDNSWSGSIASNTLTADNNGWTFSNGSGASKCAKFGASSKKGSATTPALNTAGTLSLSFRAGAWDGTEEGTTLNLSVNEGSFAENATTTSTSVTLTKGEFKTFTATIYNATKDTKITFEAAIASKNRFFLDDVVVTTTAEPISVKLNASGYATFCSQYPLDFTNASGYTAWQITDISSDNAITFTKITGSIKGGQGVLLKGEPNASVTLVSVDSENVLSSNKFKGTLAPTYIAAGEYYGLSGNTFVKVNAGTVPAGKALLPADYIIDTPGAPSFSFIFNDGETTSIGENVMLNNDNTTNQWYDLTGRKLNSMPTMKGIYILNGKKVVVK